MNYAKEELNYLKNKYENAKEETKNVNASLNCDVDITNVHALETHSRFI